MWGRFHSLDTFEPMFIVVTPKDEENVTMYGIENYNRISQDSRNSYQFIGNWARNLQRDYNRWKQRVGIELNIKQ